MKNLELWKKVEKTDPKNTKKVNYGSFPFTTVNAHSQVKKATEIFGVFGLGWGVVNETFEKIVSQHGEMLIYQSTMWYIWEDKRGELPLASSINLIKKTKKGVGIDDESVKKVVTDAMTKGLSRLGFNSDVFEGQFDDNRYVRKMQEEFANKDNVPDNKEDLEKSIPKLDAMNAIKSAFSKKHISAQTKNKYIKKADEAKTPEDYKFICDVMEAMQLFFYGKDKMDEGTKKEFISKINGVTLLGIKELLDDLLEYNK